MILKQEGLSEILGKQRLRQAEIKLSEADMRKAKLRKLRNIIASRSTDLERALYEDYQKSPSEVKLSEVFSTLAEIDFAIKNLGKWMKPRSVKSTATLFGSRSKIYYEPKGTVLIIGPWNYPFSLVINPLISAIAAGNTAIIKPSELTPHTSRLIQSWLGEIFDSSEVAVIEGGIEISKELLALPFDHIFFTGSTAVGRDVMVAAAKNLVPVTLELGGKSPVVVDDSADMKVSAKKIVWGKYFNAGQTCVAPDYLLAPASKEKELVLSLVQSISSLYGQTEEAREDSRDYCRIINVRHFKRLRDLIQDAVSKGAKIEVGGIGDEATRYLAPTVLSQVTMEMAIMHEEIFGPILPVISYEKIEDALGMIRTREKPLALYVFAQNPKRSEYVLKNTSAGGSCVNQTLLHLTNPNLPFGGVGPSGIGSYHGFFGFKTFSHERAVLRQGRWDTSALLYPPFGKWTRRFIDFLLRYLT